MQKDDAFNVQGICYIELFILKIYLTMEQFFMTRWYFITFTWPLERTKVIGITWSSESTKVIVSETIIIK